MGSNHSRPLRVKFPGISLATEMTRGGGAFSFKKHEHTSPPTPDHREAGHKTHQVVYVKSAQSQYRPTPSAKNAQLPSTSIHRLRVARLGLAMNKSK